MTADEVLKMRLDAVAPAQWVEEGKSAVWHYADLSVVLAHDGECYRVREVVKDV
jgi:hypothetical protein